MLFCQLSDDWAVRSDNVSRETTSVHLLMATRRVSGARHFTRIGRGYALRVVIRTLGARAWRRLEQCAAKGQTNVRLAHYRRLIDKDFDIGVLHDFIKRSVKEVFPAPMM